MPPPLADRIALVTGASRGIGYATALALARAGAHVVAVARTVGGLEELDDEIRKLGASATLVPLDVKDHAGIARLAAALTERYHRLDVLIGNAGIGGPSSPLNHVEPEAWDEIMAVNVTATGSSSAISNRCCAHPMPAAPCSSRPARPTMRAPTGAPTASPRRHSRYSPAPSRPRPHRPTSASTSSTPARPAPTCAPP